MRSDGMHLKVGCRNMKEERLVFKKKGFSLFEVPYNFVLRHGKEATYWTNKDSLVKWLMKHSPFSLAELRILLESINTAPKRYTSKTKD